MKKGLWQRTGIGLLCLFLLVACIAAGGALAEKSEQPETTGAPAGDPITGAAQLAESDTARLYLDTDAHAFYVENKATGYRWGSAPDNMDAMSVNEEQQKMMQSMVMISGYDHTRDSRIDDLYAYVDCLTGVADEESGEMSYPGSVQYTAVENGFKVTYTFATIDLVLPMTVTLEGDHFTARVVTDEIVFNEQDFSLLGVHILPYMGAMSNDKTGAYVLIPDGAGAVTYAGSGKVNAPLYHRPVYGKDIIIADTDYDGITLPCFGAAEGNNALLGVIKQDEADAYINGVGNGYVNLPYTRTWPSFKTMVDFEYALVNDYYSTQVFESGGIKADVLEVAYYPLSGESAGYAQMAAKYRELLFGGIQPMNGKTEPALYLDLYASVTKVRSVLGFKSAYEDVVTSTEDVMTILQALADKQVGSAVVRYNAWNKQENSEKATTKMAWIGAVGDVAELVEEAKRLNSTVYPSVSKVLTYSHSSNPFHTLSGVARDPASRLVMDENPYLTTSQIGTSYLLSYARITENLTSLLGDATDKFGAVGLSDVGRMLYSDFSKGDHKRPVVLAAISEMLADYTAENKLLLDAPNAYAGKYADEIINLPATSGGNMLLDETVPFLHLVYNGVVRYSTEALNLSGNPHSSFLKALEYGSMPCYAWIGDEGSSLINTKLDYLYSADYTYWIDTAAEQYQAVCQVAKATAGSAIADHVKLAEGVYKTVYANGAAVVVNYTDAAYTLGSESVPAAGYLIQSKG